MGLSGTISFAVLMPPTACDIIDDWMHSRRMGHRQQPAEVEFPNKTLLSSHYLG
jgi:hypothetical protein